MLYCSCAGIYYSSTELSPRGCILVAQGCFRDAQGYAAQGLRYAAQGLYYAAQRLYYAAQGLYHAAQGLHYAQKLPVARFVPTCPSEPRLLLQTSWGNLAGAVVRL